MQMLEITSGVQRLYGFLADALLVLHALVLFFNLGALPVIWLGYFRGWQFVRAFSFRVAHLLLIGYVTAETILSVVCPLTTWEDALRAKAGLHSRYPNGYVAYWLHRFIFYDLDESYFIIAYTLFFALVVFTWVWVKPRPPRWRAKPGD